MTLKNLMRESAEEGDEAFRVVDGGELNEVKQESEYVLKLDSWSKRRGRKIAKQWQEGGFGTHDDKIVAEVNTALFSPLVAPEENPADKRRAKWLEELMNSEDFRNLHNKTALNYHLAEIASGEICTEWRKYVEQDNEDGGDPSRSEDENEDGPSDIGQTIKKIRAIGEALKNASEKVEEAENISQGLGLGDENDNIDNERLAEMFKKTRKSAFLRNVLKKFGAMKTMTTAVRKSRAVHGRDDVVGVEPGGKINRAIAKELAKFDCGVSALEDLAAYRLSKKILMSRKYRGIEKVGKGPIIVSVDESGSMAGDNIESAKAIALTFGWIARQQKRWIAFSGFSGTEKVCVLTMPPGRWNEEKVIEWLTHFFGGGTTMEGPCVTIPSMWQQFINQGMPRGKVDHVIITDAEVGISDGMAHGYREWCKKEKVSTYGLILANQERDARKICDQHWLIKGLGVTEQGVRDAICVV